MCHLTIFFIFKQPFLEEKIAFKKCPFFLPESVKLNSPVMRNKIKFEKRPYLQRKSILLRCFKQLLAVKAVTALNIFKVPDCVSHPGLRFTNIVYSSSRVLHWKINN